MKAVVKIIDFGFATELEPSKGNLAHTALGTKEYMEPQILNNFETKTQNIERYDEKIDILSLGILCHEMLVGHVPFIGNNKDEYELYQKVKVGDYTFPANSSKEIASFINIMLQKDPHKRSSAKNYLDQNISKIEQLVRDLNNLDDIHSNIKLILKICLERNNFAWKNNV